MALSAPNSPGAFADGLGHGVAGDEQDGEENRAHDPLGDESDVADLLGEGLDERALRFGLGLGGRVGEFVVNASGDGRPPATGP